MSHSVLEKSGWSRIQDELPPQDKTILLFKPDYGFMLGRASKWRGDGGATHWMFLPDPPVPLDPPAPKGALTDQQKLALYVEFIESDEYIKALASALIIPDGRLVDNFGRQWRVSAAMRDAFEKGLEVGASMANGARE